MKIICSLTMIIALAGCSHDSGQTKVEDKESATNTVLFHYEPTSISLAEDISYTDSVALANLQQKLTPASFDSLVNEVIAKLHLYHLTRANQGYNLRQMNDGGARIIIDHFIASNGLQDRELITSGTLRQLYKQNNLRGYVSEPLITRIENEGKRITEMLDSILSQ